MKGTAHHTQSITWLLMSWWHKEPGHQQPWYWPSSHRTIPPQHHMNLHHGNKRLPDLHCFNHPLATSRSIPISYMASPLSSTRPLSQLLMKCITKDKIKIKLKLKIGFLCDMNKKITCNVNQIIQYWTEILSCWHHNWYLKIVSLTVSTMSIDERPLCFDNPFISMDLRGYVFS